MQEIFKIPGKILVKWTLLKSILLQYFICNSGRYMLSLRPKASFSPKKYQYIGMFETHYSQIIELSQVTEIKRAKHL